MINARFHLLMHRALELALRIILEDLQSGRLTVDEAHAKIIGLFE